ncbi:MAG: ribonuclease E inhibitor RraB [Ignavibacteriaceae bacterium]|jgi:Protein of unknown function (DUF1260).|nr:MAG: hypothetical protein EDM69_02060 [Chlorobiota bacterium]KXK02471.1 MAG: Regulator of ribonuclease activity B [Chlorobi bacterium OLB4]MBV6398067.1 hypothetical protein [Ignavibacteria bacterium]MCC6886516.1 ribonuclease E inhibitor RraB [Ignavibacteriales bacterium]MCE7952408.1 hypothetical protein [Chlorobi bacterium CHB7]MDL1886525.1 ribonuclease E inhibitor RraB [Ignavibacteria bacterium CHB1]MEB2329756.1 ribonuclease E inhibitor RraB [Ignavibacteriaceae bacterium]OQY77374.1 MAG: 
MDYNKRLLRELNARVLELININGNDYESKPIRFHFYSKDENQATNLSIELYEMGGKIKPVVKFEDRWSIVAEFNNIQIEKNDIDNFTDVMVSLAEEFDCSYDGWETEM